MIKEKEKEKEMLNSELNDKYHLEKETLSDGRIKLMLTPKKTNCFGCNKEIEFAGANLMIWTDKDHYKREGRFCRTCHQEIKKMGYLD